MNGLNRLVTSLLLLGAAAVAFSILIAIAVGFVPDKEVFGPDVTLQFEELSRLKGWQALMGISLSAFAGFVALYFLRFEVLPSSDSRRPFLVSQTELGEVTIERESVCKLVERAISALAPVRVVRATVRVGQAGLRIHCRVTAESSAVLPDLGPTMQDLVKERVESQLGLDVERVVARIRFVPYRPDRRALL